MNVNFDYLLINDSSITSLDDNGGDVGYANGGAVEVLLLNCKFRPKERKLPPVIRKLVEHTWAQREESISQDTGKLTYFNPSAGRA